MEQTAKELQKQLTWEFPNIAKEAPSQKEEAFGYCEAVSYTHLDVYKRQASGSCYLLPGEHGFLWPP